MLQQSTHRLHPSPPNFSSWQPPQLVSLERGPQQPIDQFVPCRRPMMPPPSGQGRLNPPVPAISAPNATQMHSLNNLPQQASNSWTSNNGQTSNASVAVPATTSMQWSMPQQSSSSWQTHMLATTSPQWINNPVSLPPQPSNAQLSIGETHLSAHATTTSPQWPNNTASLPKQSRNSQVPVGQSNIASSAPVPFPSSRVNLPQQRSNTLLAPISSGQPCSVIPGTAQPVNKATLSKRTPPLSSMSQQTFSHSELNPWNIDRLIQCQNLVST